MVTNVSAVRRWSMLVIALGSTMCANVFINGAAFLIPTLHGERGLDLSRAGLVSAMPSFGMVLTLIAWGWVVDRVGERFVLTVGSLLTSAAAFAVGALPSIVIAWLWQATHLSWAITAVTLLLLAVVMAMDTLSAWLRRRYIGGSAVPLFKTD